MIAYRIVEVDGGNVKTLFHGNNRSRILPINVWLKSEQKQVKDGSSKHTYLSGWHLLPSYEDCVMFKKKKFKKRLEKLKIAKCEVRGKTWDKAHSQSPIILAEEIKILEVFI